MRNITWASGLDKGRTADRRAEHGADAGRPPRLPVARGCVQLVLGVVQPAHGLFYVQTNDKCGIFTRVDQAWEAGKGFMGGTFAAAPEPARRVLRAIDIQTGKVTWELPQLGNVDSWGGVRRDRQRSRLLRR